MIKIHYIFIFFLLLISCSMDSDKINIEKWKQEILETEQNFSMLAQKEGIHKAFVTYAAEDAVLMRDNELIVGRENIDQFYRGKSSKGLSWKPDFIEVSVSGDLGYTYGHYTFSGMDANGEMVKSTGIFHTLWKRQSDGSWKFVWD